MNEEFLKHKAQSTPCPHFLCPLPRRLPSGMRAVREHAKALSRWRQQLLVLRASTDRTSEYEVSGLSDSRRGHVLANGSPPPGLRQQRREPSECSGSGRVREGGGGGAQKCWDFRRCGCRVESLCRAGQVARTVLKFRSRRRSGGLQGGGRGPAGGATAVTSLQRKW